LKARDGTSRRGGEGGGVGGVTRGPRALPLGPPLRPAPGAATRLASARGSGSPVLTPTGKPGRAPGGLRTTKKLLQIRSPAPLRSSMDLCPSSRRRRLALGRRGVLSISLGTKTWSVARTPPRGPRRRVCHGPKSGQNCRSARCRHSKRSGWVSKIALEWIRTGRAPLFAAGGSSPGAGGALGPTAPRQARRKGRHCCASMLSFEHRRTSE